MITINYTEQDIYTALRAWLLSVLPTGWEVIQGQENLVPMPIGQFVLMTSNGYERLATNVDKLDNTGLINSINTQFHYKIQLDFYGAGSSEYSAVVSSLFRDIDTPAEFPDYLKPLYADVAMQIPLITAGDNYLERWMVLSHLQFNPTMTKVVQSANALEATVIPVDVIYPA